MSKWIGLAIIAALLLAVDFFFGEPLQLHAAFDLLVAFFAVQTFVLLRIVSWVPKEWSVHASLAKVVIRLLGSMIFALILIYTQSDPFALIVQFIIVYLIFMIFEIGSALTNLRRN